MQECLLKNIDANCILMPSACRAGRLSRQYACVHMSAYAHSIVDVRVMGEATSTSSPKTVYLPLRCGAGAIKMEKCDVVVSASKINRQHLLCMCTRQQMHNAFADANAMHELSERWM